MGVALVPKGQGFGKDRHLEEPGPDGSLAGGQKPNKFLYGNYCLDGLQNIKYY